MKRDSGIFGVYLARPSWLHRWPFWLKFAAICLIAALLLAISWWPLSLAAFVLSILVVRSIGLSWRATLLPLRTLAVILGVAGIVQGLTRGWGFAAALTFGIAACAQLARALTLSTSSGEIADAACSMAKPFKRLGFNPQIFALTVVLTLGSVPELMRIFAEARESAQARGLSRSLRAHTVPVVLSVIKFSQERAEALAARGLP